MILDSGLLFLGHPVGLSLVCGSGIVIEIRK